MMENRGKSQINKNKTFVVLLAVVTVVFLTIYVVSDFLKVGYERKLLEEQTTSPPKVEYHTNIDWPAIENEEILKEISDYVESKRDDFLEKMKAKTTITPGEKYDFLAKYECKSVNDIESVHMLVSEYIGGANRNYYDRTYHYNKKTNKKINFSDFFEDEEGLKKLASLSYHYVSEFANKNEKQLNEEKLKAGTSAAAENFSNISLNEEGIEVLFVPGQVTEKTEDEIKVKIPYKELIGVFKKEYLNGVKKEENVQQKRDLKQFEGKKLIAFTFDDGPSSSHTNRLLNELDKYNARVTFFVVGSRVDKNKETLLKAYKQGNQIGNHSYSHKNLTKLSEKDLNKEIGETNKKIENVTGEKATLLRPPYGSFNDKVKKLSKMNIIMWNIDTLDWKYRDKEKIANNILKNASDGAIVLLHDLYDTSIDGALIAMKKLEKEGYAFVTIDEMCELKGVKMDFKKSYNSFK